MAKQLIAKIIQQRGSDSALRWLDWFDYGQKVILNDRDIPWGDTASLVNFLGQGQSLLKLGVASIPLGDYFNWWITQKPAALEEMHGKKRVGFALKKFLANTSLRKDLKDLISAAAASSSTPFVLSIPSPRQLLPWAHGTANQLSESAIDLEEVAVDSATVYLADFLREFADTQLAGVLVYEADNAELESEQLALYQPIVNIGDAYQWAIGVYAPSSVGTFSALDLMISENNEDCGIIARPLPDNFWSKGGKSDSDFAYGKVPADAIPEKVLEVLAGLDS